MIQFKNIEVIIISYSSCCFPPQPSGNWAKYVLVFHRSLVVHASAIMAKNVLFLFFNCRAVERPRCGLHLLHREAFPAHAQGAHPAPHHPQPHRRSRIPRHESLGEGKLVQERGGREHSTFSRRWWMVATLACLFFEGGGGRDVGSESLPLRPWEGAAWDACLGWVNNCRRRT